MINNNVVRGVVKFYDPKKGFGFVSGEGKEYFAHISNVIGALDMTQTDRDNLLKVGTKVSFMPSKNKKGLVAIQIDVIN
jgi:cold shock CspA family protein